MVILCIYPKQVGDLLHIGERQSQRILKAIRDHVNKKKNQAITIKEFCEHRGLDEKDVLANLSHKHLLSKQKP